MEMPITMVYDIETVPDLVLGRRLLGLPATCEDKEVIDGLTTRRLSQTQGSSSFLPPHLHQIVAISVVVSTPEWVKVWSLGDLNAQEADIIARFFEGIQRYTPNLVSWNGTGFDLPVLHYRSLLHRVVSSRYWETGDKDGAFKWNNYLGRYHQRHTDLMEVLAGYQSRAYVSLDEMAMLLGFPGKMGQHGSEVWEKYQGGYLESIRDYCETDVLNTYLVYLRFQYVRGQMNTKELEYEEERITAHLFNSQKSHLLAFLEMWQAHK